MPSRSSATRGLAAALFGGLAMAAWAADEAPIVLQITADMAWSDIVEPIQGKVVTFQVSEGWDALQSVDCLTLAAGSRWTFELIDTTGDGMISPTRLPGFSLGAAGATLTVTGGELSGWCALGGDTGEDTGEDTGGDTGEAEEADVYAHVISAHPDAEITLTGVGLGVDTTGLSVTAPVVGLYGLAGSLFVADQEVAGLPFPAAQLVGGTFIQLRGSYIGGATSAIVLSDGTVSLNEVSFTGGRAERGVGVDAEGGALLITDSRFDGGVAKTYGGAIAAQGAVVVLDDVAVASGQAAEGGGVWAQGGSLTITGGEITGNVASERGGGVFIDQATQAKVKESSFTGNRAPLGGGLSVRSVETLEITDTLLTDDAASLKGGGLHLQQVSAARLCGLTLSGATALVSGGGIYATDSTITLGAEDGSCAASQILGAVAPQGAALSVIDTGDAPDDVGLSAVDLTLSQLNGGEAEGTTKDQAIYVSTPGALALRGLTTPGGLGSLALLTAIEAEVTLHDVSVVNEAITQSSNFAAVQQSVISLTRPASVDLQRARICGFVAQGETTGALDMVTIDAPAGDVLLEQSALWGAASFGALVRVIPDDSGLSDAEVILRHNSLIGGIKDFQDGATIFAGSVVATGNLLSRLDVGLVLSGQDGETETYNLFSETVSTPRRDEGGQTVRIDDTSTDDVAPLDLVPAFKETSCAALPELLESSPAVNGGDPTGAPDPDGSIPDQGALPITLDDTDGDGSFDVDDCAPDDPTIGDTLDEVYGDGLDNDCDPSTIDDDEDGDGLSRDVDCDDADPTLCPPVTQFFGGRAACGCAAATATPGAPWPLWLAPLAGIILRRRRRQAP